MDRTEEDMKLVGFFGIFKQSFKSIFSSTKIFTQITLAFILPLAIIFLVQLEVAQHVFWRIENNSLPYDTNDSREATPLEWVYYALYTIGYYIFLTIFSILSTATVVFTVAAIYTGREVVFANVIKVIPKVWKRLCITFIFIYITIFIYNILLNLVTAIFRAVFGNSLTGAVVLIIILIVFGLLFLNMTVVFELASVVSVLENVQGWKALKKGKALARGKAAVGMGIAFVLSVFLAGLIVVYLLFVEHGHETVGWPLTGRVMMGILCGILFLMLFLLFVVSQTVLYLVCKSYHREAIDKVSLSTFLSDYVVETVVYPGAGDEIQLGRTQPPAEQV